MLAIAQALELAHKRDIFHRDIKPENMLFDGGRVKLLDWGIARIGTSPRPRR